jgi:hypothetical protein
MKLIIENSEQIVEVNGVPARVWLGRTESGIDVQCLITRIAVLKTDDCSQFDRELHEQAAPRSALLTDAFPLRMIL